MKNRVFQLLMTALLFSFLPACNEDEVIKEDGSDELAIVIDAGLTITKAVDADWEAGDAIGVTMYNAAYTQMYDGVYNTKYVTNDNGQLGRFNAAVEDETLYFPQNGDEIRLNAYYPYQENLPSNMRIAWPVTDQSVLQDIDLMTAQHLAGFSKRENNVRFRFYHRLVKMVFILSTGEEEDIPFGALDMKILNAEQGNTYDLVADRFLNFSTGAGDIDVPLRNGEAGTYRQAILLPRTAGEGLVFEFTNPATGDFYIANMSEDLELEGGNQYTFLIELSENPVTVSATIEPWVERGPYTYQSLQVGTPAGESDGVNIGDVMNVYLQEETGDAFALLRTFTYESANNWQPNAPVFWEDIAADPATFRASIIAEQALNGSQMADILIADEITVPRHTGVDFVLRHVGSKATVSLISDTFSGNDLADASVTFPDYLGGGYEETGAFIPGTTRADVLAVRTDGTTAVAIFQPQAVAAADPLLTVTINGRTYDAFDEDGFTFEPGTAYQIIVEVRKEGLSISATVVDWTEQELTLQALTIGTPVSGAEGVLNGEILNVYTGDLTTREFLNGYTYDAAQNVFTSPTTIYWESLEDPTTFFGSILRQAAYNDTQMDDYLVATPETVAASNGVHFDLEHASARVEVQLTSTDGTFSTDELNAMQLILPDYKTGGTINNGVYIPGTATGSITVQPNVGTEANSNLAFIDPQTIPAGTTVINVIGNNRTYSATYADDVVYSPNQSTILYVDLSKTEVTISAEVVDWTEQTISMVAPNIVIDGDLDGTSDFFENKSIYIYKLGNDPQTWIYSYQNTGNGYEWEGPELYWDDQTGLALNMTAVYYPAGESAITNNTFPWSIGANQNESADNYYDNYDLLTSHLELPEPDYANFKFTHATSLVQINLIPGIGFTQDELTGVTVTLNDYLLTGTVDLNTGVIGNISGSADVTPRTDEDGKSYSALVMPQTKAAGSTIVTITIPEYGTVPFTGTLTTPLVFTAGQQTTINVTLNRTEIQLSATLQPWGTGDTGNIIIQ